MQNDFKLPIIKETKSAKRVLSMDDYLEFVQFNLKNAFDKEAYAKWKKMRVINAPFSIS